MSENRNAEQAAPYSELGRYKKRQPRENERILDAYDVERLVRDFVDLRAAAEAVMSTYCAQRGRHARLGRILERMR